MRLADWRLTEVETSDDKLTARIAKHNAAVEKLETREWSRLQREYTLLKQVEGKTTADSLRANRDKREAETLGTAQAALKLAGDRMALLGDLIKWFDAEHERLEDTYSKTRERVIEELRLSGVVNDQVRRADPIAYENQLRFNANKSDVVRSVVADLEAVRHFRGIAHAERLKCDELTASALIEMRAAAAVIAGTDTYEHLAGLVEKPKPKKAAPKPTKPELTEEQKPKPAPPRRGRKKKTIRSDPGPQPARASDDPSGAVGDAVSIRDNEPVEVFIPDKPGFRSK